MNLMRKVSLILIMLLQYFFPFAQTGMKQEQASQLAVIAYYAGRSTMIDSFDLSKLTHIIFSFCHLQGERMDVSNARDSATIHELIALKSKNPGLKVLLSLGGW